MKTFYEYYDVFGHTNGVYFEGVDMSNLFTVSMGIKNENARDVLCQVCIDKYSLKKDNKGNIELTF